MCTTDGMGEKSGRQGIDSRAGVVVSSELGEFSPVADVQLLAALDRAQLHQARSDGVLFAQVGAHLGFRHSSWTTRRLRPQLEALEDAAKVARFRRHGLTLWGITSVGRRALSEARACGVVIVLPESPQHRQWRHQRSEAGRRIGGFRDCLREALQEASMLLDADTPAPSDAWHWLAGQLQIRCEQLRCGAYCLYEWSEPDDASADIDTELGRRHMRSHEDMLVRAQGPPHVPGA
jgi:hypothetical protein